jgi:predicted AlkP superfamily pyrophosphatase or phosphodiesterase
MNVVDDPVQSTIGGSGRAASPVNSLAFTIGDVLKRDQPLARVVGVSGKDRSAILLGGRRADAAYWFENKGGNFITSTYYMKAPPEWLTEWNNRRIPDRFAGETWTRLIDDPALYEKYAGKDAIPSERDGKDIVFPHAFTAKAPAEAYYVELRRTPFLDQVILDFAIEAMKRHELGKDDVTDVIAVGLSANDGIGHAFGLDSQEAMDHLLRLDRQLDRFFKEIEAIAGPDRALFVLSADHGSRPLVEVSQARGMPARRVAPAVLEKAVASAFEKRYPGVKGLVSYFNVDFYLDKDVISRYDLNMKDVEKTAIDALMATGAVERVYTQDELRSTGKSSDPFLILYQNAYFEPRSPHLNILLKKDVYMTASSYGTGHGSAWDFDRHVPVLFMGSGIKPGRYTGLAGPEDIAPTLGRLLGLVYPRESDSRLLTEMLH